MDQDAFKSKKMKTPKFTSIVHDFSGSKPIISTKHKMRAYNMIARKMCSISSVRDSPLSAFCCSPDRINFVGTEVTVDAGLKVE